MGMEIGTILYRCEGTDREHCNTCSHREIHVHMDSCNGRCGTNVPACEPVAVIKEMNSKRMLVEKLDKQRIKV